MLWHRVVTAKLQASGLFSKVELVGGKIRATIDGQRFLDIHFDPTTSSYSYAVIDQTLKVSGDKRLFGWDDFPLALMLAQGGACEPIMPTSVFGSQPTVLTNRTHPYKAM
ncbi:MAG: hypothetical protein HY782_10055 [Chloroflexi bacterium]|nr:hypothetical protein [Chloroflexota bacterium]